MIIKIPYNQHKVYEPSSKLTLPHTHKKNSRDKCAGGSPRTDKNLSMCQGLDSSFLREYYGFYVEKIHKHSKTQRRVTIGRIMQITQKKPISHYLLLSKVELIT